MGLGETKGLSYPSIRTAPLQGISNKGGFLDRGGAVAITSVQLKKEEAWDTHEGQCMQKAHWGRRVVVPSQVLPLCVPHGDCMQEAGFI